MKNTFVEIVYFLFICLFLYTGFAKLMDYDLTREQMAVMPLVKPIAATVTWLLPLSEIVLGVFLFLPRTRKVAMYFATALMLFFTVYVAYLLKYHKHLPCSCGGFLQALSWTQHLFFNGAFVLLGFLAIRIGNMRRVSSTKKVALL